ncbi:MAG: hypothetical protein O2960_21760 [Verrucomicrobia bacterium]|nr:hypothetical protein [Verrucomicrobiota bacterium]
MNPPFEIAMNELTALEKDILSGASGDGLIHFPQGTVRSIEGTFIVLKGLAKRGFVRRLNRTGFRAFWLTVKGRRCARALQMFPRETLAQAA